MPCRARPGPPRDNGRMTRAPARLCLSLALPLAVLALWEGAAEAGALNAFLLPGPGAVLAAVAELARTGTLARDAAASFSRVMMGFALSTALAVPTAIALARWRVASDLLRVPLNFLRATPPLALLPLLVLWFGIGEAAKWIVVVLASFFPILLNTVAGLRGVAPQHLELARALELTRAETVRFIVVPSALPVFVAGLRLGFGYCWRAMVGAELIATSVGLGFRIMDAQSIARVDVVYAGILVLGTLGFLADQIFLLAARRLCGGVHVGE